MRDCSGNIASLSKLVALLPRGRGAFPRLVGKVFARELKDCYVVTRHGVNMVVTPEALDFYTTMARSDWAFDYWVLDTCAALMPPDGVFYDVGANVGYLSLEMTRLRPNCAQIASFEPQAELARDIRRSCELNGIGNITVLEACVGESSGFVEFVRERHSIHGHVRYTREDDTQRASNGAELIALDEVVHKRDLPPPDVIKIDVEGYEYSVLQGARSLIANHQPSVVFELSDATPKFGHRPREFFDLLSSLGDYGYEIAVGSYREPVVIDDLSGFDKKFHDRAYQTNILARSRIRSSQR